MWNLSGSETGYTAFSPYLNSRPSEVYMSVWMNWMEGWRDLAVSSIPRIVTNNFLGSDSELRLEEEEESIWQVSC